MDSRDSIFPLKVYYEDTDITGVVYHANYLRYFERARTEIFGADRLFDMQQKHGIGILVYRAEMQFREGAALGDQLEIRSRPELRGDFRVVVHQRAIRPRDGVMLVNATIELVCVQDRMPIRVPDWIVEKINKAPGE